jgi:hypothetical protein
MNKEKSCNCPICNSIFIPDDGMDAAEFLARNIIKVCAEMQDRGESEDCSLCYRCGLARMIQGVNRNALSRQMDIMVCSICGTDEAIRQQKDCVLPLTDWWIVKEILQIY